MSAGGKAANLTAMLVAEIQGIAAAEHPREVRTFAAQCILDWLAVAIAGARERVVEILLDEIDAARDHPRCTIVGHGMCNSPVSAALINGCAGDALDFSDTHPAMFGHGTACVLPAALAVAEERNASGAELIRSFVVGIETACRVGLIVDIEIMQGGFHPTAVFGPFGAASAVAQQLGLDTSQWRQALGLVATQAAGLKASAGTMAKPFHAGRAASSGVLAARLAAHGFTGAADVLEQPGGFLDTHSRDPGALPQSDALAKAHGRFLILDTSLKSHASCQLTHTTIENMLRLKAETTLAPERIASIELHVPESYLRVCNVAMPDTELEAKFSLRTTAAFALLGYDTGQLATFADRFREPDVAALRERISVTGHRDMSFHTASAVITLTDGRHLEATAEDRPERDLSRRDRLARKKFRNLVEPVLGPKACTELDELVGALDTLPSLTPILRRLGEFR